MRNVPIKQKEKKKNGYVHVSVDKRRNLPQIFKKGEVHNPHGRPPKEKCIPDILRKIGSEPGSPDVIKSLQPYFPHVNLKEATGIQVMMYMCHLQAQKGDDRAREFIAERTEGKIKEFFGITDERVEIDIDDAKNKEPEICEEIGTDDKDPSNN